MKQHKPRRPKRRATRRFCKAYDRRRLRWMRRAYQHRTGVLKTWVPKGHNWVPYTHSDHFSGILIGRAFQEQNYGIAKRLILEGCIAEDD